MDKPQQASTASINNTIQETAKKSDILRIQIGTMEPIQSIRGKADISYMECYVGEGI